MYEKAGNANRALNLAFEHNLDECVEQLTYALRYENDAELIEKSARFFIQKENFDIAVKLLAKVKKVRTYVALNRYFFTMNFICRLPTYEYTNFQYDEAIRICNKRRIHMTEETADVLTPDEDYPNRIDIVNQLGEIAFAVGNYHLAARKFTEAGNKVRVHLYCRYVRYLQDYFIIKYDISSAVLIDKSDEGFVKIWRYEKNHLLRERIARKRNIHHGGELFTNFGLPNATRIFKTYHQLLHERKSD